MELVCGTYAVRMIPTRKVRVPEKGGLCVIEPGLAHVCIVHPGARAPFFKVPVGNDKVPVEPDQASREWVEGYCAAVDKWALQGR